MALSEDDLEVAFRYVAHEEEYDDLDRRKDIEEQSRHRFAAYVKKEGVRLLDAPVSRWEKVEHEFFGKTLVQWEYRLLGIALRSPT